MTWLCINEFHDEILYRGSRICVSTNAANDREEVEISEYMVFDLSIYESSGLALLQISGYKAGSIHVVLPNDSCPRGHRGISVKWLVQNWQKWIGGGNLKYDLWVTKDRLNPRLPRKF